MTNFDNKNKRNKIFLFVLKIVLKIINIIEKILHFHKIITFYEQMGKSTLILHKSKQYILKTDFT